MTLARLQKQASGFQEKKQKRAYALERDAFAAQETQLAHTSVARGIPPEQVSLALVTQLGSICGVLETQRENGAGALVTQQGNADGAPETLLGSAAGALETRLGLASVGRGTRQETASVGQET